jgi:hypothetical protein
MAKKKRSTGGLGGRILDCIREEVEEEAEQTPATYNKQVVRYNKQVLVAGGAYVKGNYVKGDANPVRQPPPGFIRVEVDVKLKTPRKKRKRPRK